MTHINTLNQDTFKQAILNGQVIASNADSITYKINDTHSLIVPMHISKDENGNIEEHYITNEPTLVDDGNTKKAVDIWYSLSMIFQIQADFKKLEIEKKTNLIQQINTAILNSQPVESQDDYITYQLADGTTLAIPVTIEFDRNADDVYHDFYISHQRPNYLSDSYTDDEVEIDLNHQVTQKILEDFYTLEIENKYYTHEELSDCYAQESDYQIYSNCNRI